MTTINTQKNDFKRNIVGFLLFSSMLNPTEIYLSKETKRKAAKSKNSIDREIEIAMQDTKNPSHTINELLTIESVEDAHEDTPVNKIADEIKSALKSLYHNFAGYAKKAYAAIRTATKKIIEGPVRTTTEKFCKVGQYIMAAVCPQWNMPTLSKFDLDTLSVQIANHVFLDKESIKYNSGYAALRYFIKD